MSANGSIGRAVSDLFVGVRGIIYIHYGSFRRLDCQNKHIISTAAVYSFDIIYFCITHVAAP